MSTGIRLVIECDGCGRHNRMERLVDPRVAQKFHILCHDCEAPLTVDTTPLALVSNPLTSEAWGLR